MSRNRKRRRHAAGYETKGAPAPVFQPASIAAPSTYLLDLFGAHPVSSGVPVTPATAMRCTAVRCGVLAISEAIGQLPVHVYARGADDTRKRVTNHPVYDLLHDAANDFTPASEFRQLLTADALLHGNGLAYINRVADRPIELIRLAPETVTIDANERGEPRYRIDGRLTPRADIFHLRAPSSINGHAYFKGDSPIMQAAEAIGLAITMEQHAARLFGNGAKPSGLISFPGNLSLEAAAKGKAAWERSHRGANSGGTAVLDNGATWTPLALNSTDAQFLELRRFALGEIARALRVPPHMLFDLERGTWANVEAMGGGFATFTLVPWIGRWEGEIALKLFGPDERRTHFAEFLTDDLLRADLAQRAEAYAKLIAARVLNPNEARALENRAPYAGGDVFANPNTSTGAPQPETPARD